MTDLSNKPISYTGSHPLELAYRALLARAEAAEAEAARIEEARLYYQERTIAMTAAVDAERANNKAAWQRVAELEAKADRHAQDYDDLHQDYREMRRNWEGTAGLGAALALAEARVAELEAASEPAIDKWADAARSETQLRLDAAEARVAELEAELAAQSAQGWRDFTEHPPIGELIQIVTVIDAVREEPDGLYRIGHTSEWQTWRPAPQETE